jgi:nanoRNase/pAp phosphatase (c-di-AMP/oligoRNAs hydrolase)
MGPSAPIGPVAPRQVTIIGHHSQIVPTVGFFVGGSIQVRVYTSKADLEHQLAPYPGVHVTVVPGGYQQRPADLPEPPYFIAAETEEESLRIKGWLPPTVAIFWLGSEQRRRSLAKGFLSLMPSPAANRRQVLRRFAALKRVDTLMDLARAARQPFILMYSDPDPDAIGAALGLASIWRHAGATAQIRYTGEVQRYQNKLLINYLKYGIERLKEDELESADLIAVVDAQPGFWRDRPPNAQVVIDHHPRREDTTAAFLDLREGYGSTSSILTEYLVEADLAISRPVATALLYGLTSDTDDLNRNAGPADIRAFDVLHPLADHHFLARLDKSQVPMSVLDYIAWGISHRVVFRDLILIHFGEVPTPDIMVQVADLVLLTHGINWAVCAGVVDGKLVVIFRGDGHHQNVGKRASLAFAKLGSAGGHRTMGRAEIPLRKGEESDDSVAILVNNLFKRMSPARRAKFIKLLKGYVRGEGPDKHEDFEVGHTGR